MVVATVGAVGGGRGGGFFFLGGGGGGGGGKGWVPGLPESTDVAGDGAGDAEV